MITARLPTAVLLAALAAGATTIAVLPSARAAEGLSLSLDGEHWGTTVDTPLWDPSVRWVPGDSRTVSVWVRNDTGDPSTLHLEVVSSAPAGDTELADRLSATARVDGTGTDVDDDLVPVPAPPPRQRQRVELTMTFPASAGNHTQTDVAATRIRITLSERVDPGASDHGGRLPGTGGPALALLATGGAGVVLGAGLVRARRPTRDGSR